MFIRQNQNKSLGHFNFKKHKNLLTYFINRLNNITRKETLQLLYFALCFDKTEIGLPLPIIKSGFLECKINETALEMVISSAMLIGGAGQQSMYL